MGEPPVINNVSGCCGPGWSRHLKKKEQPCPVGSVKTLWDQSPTHRSVKVRDGYKMRRTVSLRKRLKCAKLGAEEKTQLPFWSRCSVFLPLAPILFLGVAGRTLLIVNGHIFRIQLNLYLKRYPESSLFFILSVKTEFNYNCNVRRTQTRPGPMKWDTPSKNRLCHSFVFFLILAEALRF